MNTEIKKAIARIDAKKEYDISGLRAARAFPWVKYHPSYRIVIRRDMEAGNVMKTKVEGSGRGAQYKIKGAAVVEFLRAYGEAMMMMANKNKK